MNRKHQASSQSASFSWVSYEVSDSISLANALLYVLNYFDKISARLLTALMYNSIVIYFMYKPTLI